MKKAEAISILTTSVRPREAKDRARYDEAVKMAIEALKSSEQTAESAQNASSCARENDVIFRQAAIDALKGLPTWWADEGGYYGGTQPPMVALLDPEDAVSAIENLPSAQPATSCSEIPNGSDDTISRRAAIDALARMMPRSYTPDGSHPADEEIFRAQEVFADCIEALEILPSVQPDLSEYSDKLWKSAYERGRAEAEADEDDWTLCSKRLPEDTRPVNITWVNREPESYYADIKDVPFTATGHYCKGKWYWYSVTCQYYLDEYGECEVDAVDNMIEVTAWKPLPEPYRGGEK